MGEVIGELLPVALGVAISPVPIIAVILMLLAPHAKAASVAFCAGWVLGISAVVTMVAVAVDPVDDSESGDPSTLASVLKIVLGAAAVLLSVKSWRSRPRGDEEPTMPKWMSAVDTLTATRALGLGALLSAVNPKNLTLCLTGGVMIGCGALSAGEQVAAVVVFVVIGSCTVALPVLGYLTAQQRMQQPLDDLRQWLTAHNAAVMAVLLLVIGVAVVGKGVAGL
ncbi:GAP family protein [Nocardioides sp. W7]|uniref:GAP family protein n=1 Tax=Nocardioides sp. W7 TaxID=2931390 RepID=UPI001FD11D2B|nr:GAP family protein [Nocardioides sp. W7]